jgi:copper chaperone NosL
VYFIGPIGRLEEISVNRKISLLALLLLLAAATAFAMQHMADVEKHASCNLCGMDRHMFAQSRMLITYGDGTEAGTCSIHCAALDLALNIDKTPKSIQVGDFNTKELIDAEKAFWVIGGDKMGVMTKRAKWAFATEDAAKAFIKEHGGEPASFDQAVEETFKDMYADTNMIRKKRKGMDMKKGHSGHGH